MASLQQTPATTQEQSLESTWTWVFGEQKWYHETCDAYADPTTCRCPLCQQDNPDSFRWSEVLQWAEESASGRMADYVSLDRDYVAKRTCADDQVLSGKWRIAIWWCVGGNEGWYVHVDAISGIPDQEYNRADGKMLAKFLSSEADAIAFATALTQFIYSHPY